MSDSGRKTWLVAAVIILVLVLIGVVWYHRSWMKKHCTCSGFKGGIHGWRGQHYDDNPYNGQNYHCGQNAVGYPYFGPNMAPRHDTFTGDLDGWPTSGTYGNLADTFPYGNYANGEEAYFPTMSELHNTYWTRS